MRHRCFFSITLSLLLAAPLSASAQQRKELRDSLAAAAQRMAYHPDSVDLRLRKASFNMQLEEWDYAKSEYDYVLQREPYNPAALFFRAYANTQLGRHNFARLDYQNLLTVVPQHYEGQMGLVLLNQKDRHLTEAIDGANRLVSQFPDSAAVYAVRAGIERERGMNELAEFDYSEAVRLAPDNKDYLLNHADLLIILGRRHEAKALLQRLVALGVPRASLMHMFRKCRD